jgi:hypothetical protein
LSFAFETNPDTSHHFPPYLPPDRAADAPVSEPWKSAHTGTHSHGSHVICHWNFDGPDAPSTSGPQKLPGRLQSAHAAAVARFGGAIDLFRGLRTTDIRHALVVAFLPTLSPAAAFSA